MGWTHPESLSRGLEARKMAAPDVARAPGWGFQKEDSLELNCF